jgi:hypothetical protein
LVSEAAAALPDQYNEDVRRLEDVKRKERNLIEALEDGKPTSAGIPTSAAVRQRLNELATEAETLQQRVESYQQLMRREIELPDDQWLAEALCKWSKALEEDTAIAATVLRKAVGFVSAHTIVAPGKQRGYCQLRFRVNGWEALRAVLGGRLPESLAPLDEHDDGVAQKRSPEYALDLGQPSTMDRWAPQIAGWRAEGVKWKEIVGRTGLDLNRAYRAWKRFTNTQDERPQAG